MFYVRTRLNDELSIEIDITGDNVYTRCADCSAEIAVDLDDLVGLDQFHLDSRLCCEKCSARRLIDRGEKN